MCVCVRACVCVCVCVCVSVCKFVIIYSYTCTSPSPGQVPRQQSPAARGGDTVRTRVRGTQIFGHSRSYPWIVDSYACMIARNKLPRISRTGGLLGECDYVLTGTTMTHTHVAQIDTHTHTSHRSTHTHTRRKDRYTHKNIHTQEHSHRHPHTSHINTHTHTHTPLHTHTPPSQSHISVLKTSPSQ